MTQQRRMEDLEQTLSLLREQKSRIDTEAKALAEKRNKANNHYKILRDEILELKIERDKLNEQVKNFKQQRNEVKTEIHGKIELVKKINDEIKTLNGQKPSRNLQSLQKEIDNNEWKIQTTSLSIQEEKKLIEQTKRLDALANVHRKLNLLRQKKFKLQTELKLSYAQNTSYHEKMLDTAQKSQKIHLTIIEKMAETRKRKMTADEFHKLFLQEREKVAPIQLKINEISNQLKKLQDKIREEEETERKKTESVLRNRLEEQAREKLKRGEKLTWEEFQLLASDMETDRKT